MPDVLGLTAVVARFRRQEIGEKQHFDNHKEDKQLHEDYRP